MNLPESNNQEALPGVFEQVCAGEQTARLTINYPDGDGVFYFADGELIEARLGELTGEAAFRQAIQQPQESFRVDLGVTVPPRAIFADWAALLNGESEKPEAHSDAETEVAGTEAAQQAEAISTAEAAMGSAETSASEEQENQNEYRDSAAAQKDNVTPISAGKSAIAENAARPLAEVPVMSSVNQRIRPAVLPASAASVTDPDDHSRIQAALAATGVLQSGLVIDEDGVVVSELGESDAALAQTAFMVAGLESLVTAVFDLGQCEGALLDQNGVATMVTRASSLSCAFVPVPRTPVARAFNETRRALEAQGGGRE
ncbi:MAG TPA: DUF4388 domain-containing protein [Blastocatellia bacterium]|nr:DUF4388 domain-containing protein [Blastocatellia bacterium]